MSTPRKNLLKRSLIVLASVIVAVLAFVGVCELYPRVMGLYYQVQGGMQLRAVLREAGMAEEIACANTSLVNNETSQKLIQLVEKLEKSKTYSPHFAQTYLLLGRCYCALGEYESALEAYGKYRNIKPGNPLGYLEAGFGYDAMSYSQQFKEMWKKSGMSEQDLLEAGSVALESNQNEVALQWFRRALIAYPESGQSWLNQGRAYEKIGNYQLALGAYEKAYSLSPQEATTELALFYSANDKRHEMKNVLKSSLENYTSSKERLTWWRVLSEDLKAHEEWDEAHQALTKALSEFPNDPLLYFYLGWVLYDGEKSFQAAYNEFLRGIQASPDWSNNYYAIGVISVREGLYDQADKWFASAIEKDPSNEWYHVNRANAARKAGNLQTAVDIAKEAIEYNPNFSRVYYELAWTYMQLEQLNNAVSAIESALKLSNNILYYERAACVYEVAGDKKKAVMAYQEILKLEPNNSLARDALLRLGEE